MQLRKLLFFIGFIVLALKSFPVFGQDSLTQANLRARAYELDSIIKANPSKQTSSFGGENEATTLPIGIVREIGDIIYAICIDSARFTPQGATFDVYMAIDWPGSYDKLAFAAKGIPFNPKGVMGSNPSQIRLQLVGDQTLRLGPNNSITFKGDGSNYIQWGCNGYERININADFKFSEKLIHKPGGGQVKANIQVNVEDISQIMFQSTIEPFVVNGLEDYVFQINQLSIDRSESANPPNIVLPGATNNLYPDINNWMGFYAQQLTVTLPEKFKKNNGSPTTLGVTGLMIDDNGVSGSFFATNIFAITQGNMNSWAYSMDSLVLKLEYNNVNEARIAGSLSVPQLDNQSFKYKVSMSRPDTETPYGYNFYASIDSNIVYPMSLLKSELIIKNNSSLNVQIANNQFIPKLTLNGKISLKESKARLSNLEFTNLILTSEAPYLLGGVFALTSNTPDSNKLLKHGLNLNSLQLGISQQNVIFSVNATLKLGSEDNSNSFTVTAGFSVVTKREQQNGRERLAYDKLNIDAILIDINTSAIRLLGTIVVKKDDPVFGDLFFGSIGFQLKKLMDQPASVSAGFGKLNGNKYWYVDASVPVYIPLGAVAITNINGGAHKGVISTTSNTSKMDKAFASSVNNTYTQSNIAQVVPFTPDPNSGFGFHAGVAFSTVSGESLMNGEAVLSVQFNTSGGFSSIGLDGRVVMLCPRALRGAPAGSKTLVEGTISLFYDNEAKVFDANVGANLTVAGYLTGSVALKVHFDPDNWYFWLNRPANRAYLDVKNLFTAQAYFMIGTQIDPIPAPPSYVTNLVSSSPVISTDLSSVSSGNGFATGLMVSAGFDGEFPKETKWRGYIAISLGVGCDVMMTKLLPTAHCSGVNGKLGISGWYVQGQVYAWLNGSLGARKYNDDGELKNEYQIGSINAAALLQGRLPKPTFIYGTVGFEVSIASIINFDFDASIQFGNDCTIVN